MSTKYYQKTKKDSKRCQRYQNLSEEEKDKRCKKSQERYNIKSFNIIMNLIKIFLRKKAAVRRNNYITQQNTTWAA